VSEWKKRKGNVVEEDNESPLFLSRWSFLLFLIPQNLLERSSRSMKREENEPNEEQKENRGNRRKRNKKEGKLHKRQITGNRI
jgi:hypothetical protein